ncbi:SDR family oxidoreductase [Aequorivita sp. H23M31]|uniref:SDR family oxidoreductase n=1 Tax=Aequorivita ciconiae TaxID=2494375 RepID=A0A410G486_9FLAO|nr:SDR family oxidoreductase [Aequorivita sp. H23M31]QAA82025.1 SDR family oxidoreductase [Aequorivita sp. H23M31]
MKNTERKIALVTGAGTGLGRAIAKTLAEQDFKVVLTGRREDKLREVQNELGKENAIVITADILDEKSVAALKETLLEQTDGSLDLLVNNVGGVPAMGTIEEMNLDQWQQVMDKNLTSAFLTTKAFLPALRKSNKGTVISVTSGAVHNYFPGMGAYSVSKAALESFVKVLGEEEKDNGISTHLFDPGNVISEANPHGEQDPMEIMDKIVALVN